MTIRSARIRAGYTQENIARALNITLRSYIKIEKGENLPNVRTGLRLAFYFGVDPYSLWPI